MVIVGVLALASCFQEERVYTLNPDGSGKVEFTATFSTDSVISFSDEKPDPEKKAKNAVTTILEESEGVSAWTDVSYEMLDDKKVKFHGTAYFADVNKLKLKMGSTNADNLSPQFSSADGVATLACPLDKKDEDDEKKDTPDEPAWDTLTKEQQDAKIAEAKRELTKMKGMIGAMAADMTTKITLVLPAKSKTSVNFEKVNDTTVTVSQNGADMVAALDKLLADEELLRQAASSKVSMQDGPPPVLTEMMFGVAGDPVVTFAAGAAPAFDYKAEVVAAQKAFPKMVEVLGLTAQVAPPMSENGEFKSIRLAGLRMVTEAEDSGVRPFNWSPGVTLAFIAELPGSVISADDGEITTFLLENDQNMLSSNKYDRKPKSIDISDDGKWLKFEVESDQFPELGGITITELTGEVICMAADGSEVVDLGFKKIAPDEEGTVHGAKVLKVGEHSYQDDKFEVEIRLELSRDMIKEVKFYDADGVEIEARQSGSSWSGKRVDFSFTLDAEPSPDMKVKADIYTEVKRIPVAFKIEDVLLLPEAK